MGVIQMTVKNREVERILKSIISQANNLQDFIEEKAEEIREVQNWDQDLHYDVETLASRAATIYYKTEELIEHGEFQDE